MNTLVNQSFHKYFIPPLFFILITLTIIYSPHVHAVNVPDTNQTECYNTEENIPCPAESEPFYGQDAHYTINPHQLVKMDISGKPLPETSGTWAMVLDQTTGLMWEVKTDDNSVHDRDNMYSYYYLDEKFIKRLNQDRFGGFSDWRLPKVRELNTLTDIQQDRPAIDSDFFPHTVAYDYWSETANIENQSQGWCVSFFHGNDTIQSRQSQFHVRAVRGEIFYDPDRFVDNDDGTITDTVTGLMWQKETTMNSNWKNSLNYCNNLELAGYNDWRLPGREVLRSIVDYNRFAAALDMHFFPKTTSTAYWSSTTDQQNMNQAWCIHFQYGNDLSRTKNQLYSVRAVRGGQIIKEGHLKIITPSTGDRLSAGMATNIQWQSSNFNGLVDIQLSKFGGLDGSFETIIANTENDGSVEWIVTGDASENCVIRIIPQDNPLSYADQGMFSIDHFSGAWVDILSMNNYHTYRLLLMGQYTDHIEAIETDWFMADSPGTLLSENVVSATENSWVKVFCRFENLTYERWVGLFTKQDLIESEPNSAKNQSILMKAGRFYTGFITNNDVDMYKIALFSDEIIEIAFLPETDFADEIIQIFDEIGNRIFEKTSFNGQSFHSELGLTEGNYYVKIASYGDSSPLDPYNLSYVSIGSLPGNTPIPIKFGDTATGSNASLVDIPKYTFTLNNPEGVIIDFYPPNLPVGYQIALKNGNQTIMDQSDCLDQQKVHLEILLEKGSYSIEIQAKNQVDRSAKFKLYFDKSPYPIEKEDNDSFENATPLNPNLPIRGSLSHSSDIDIYAFDQNKPEIKQLTFADPSDNSDTWIRIYKDNEYHVIQQFLVPDGTFFSKQIGLTVGRYTIQLSGQSVSQAHQYYTLEITPVSALAVEIEPNDTKTWCSSLENKSWMRGMVYPETDTDWYGFNMTTSGFVHMSFEGLNNQAVYVVNLLDNIGNTLSTRSISQSQTYTAIWMVDPGDTYILVKGNGEYHSIGEYRLQLETDQSLIGLKRIQSISIGNTPPTLTTGTVHPLSAFIHFSNAEITPLTNVNWYVLDETVAKIDSIGRVTALSTGTTTVIAEFQRKIAECVIGVEQMPSDEINDYGELILIAGSHDSETAPRFQTTQYLASLVYKRFLERRFKHDDIFYMNAVKWHDYDGDGYDDNIVDIPEPRTDAFVKLLNERKSSKTTGPLYIYLIGPSGNNAFEIAPEEYLSIALLKELLRNFYIYDRRPIIVVMESPKAGQFLDGLFLENTHIFISPSTIHDAHTMFDGQLSFTQFFLDNLSNGNTIDEAFQLASVSLHHLRQPFLNMSPEMLANTTDIAKNIQLGGNFNLTLSPIQLTALNPQRTITANVMQDIEIQLTPSEQVLSVYAMISSPDYLVPGAVDDFIFPDTHRNFFSLSHEPDSNRWINSYNEFKYSGRYWIDLCVIDKNNYLSTSQAFSFSVINGKATDMDYDGMPDTWEDSYIGLDKTVFDSQNDLDKDGLSNLNEYLFQCDPTVVDSDKDHLNDGWEVQNKLDPIDPTDAWADPDGDHVSNYQEFLDSTDPQNQLSFIQHYGDIRGEIYTDLVGYEAGIKGAQIILLENESTTASTQDGLFLFRNMPYGRYTVEISAANFKGYSKKIILSQSNAFVGKIRLLYEAEHPGCDFNMNSYLDLPDIIRALQIMSNMGEW
ncbi:Developmentally regulated MAPK interacting protein [Candidatus Magnetomorum sp. HK-1]|nr:Developmentally regulated MAPK interacting protein [Candidatus Magnetomorum sp. HK-1]